ncbi:hypothetical protein LTR62_007861 [Meristemomyces frigidus]|uniref:NmrA-like domain-containing protein n=1 Tax=Meristemomyces frigidus TaxID=1508187 RepID=A0AAN7TB56_9PEZI|nr:hypothetical protein LTR62_007861 [Meristemomyces frigidus]
MTVRVAVIGPNGTLGPPIITRLLEESSIDLTLLTRHATKTAQQYPLLHDKIVVTDYSSNPQLTQLFRDHGFDVLVILINRHELEPQLRLIDAACAVGGLHVLPSSFGVNTAELEVRRLPQMKEKIEMEQYLAAKAEKGEVSFTAVNTGLFFDWALGSFMIPQSQNQPFMIADAGTTRVSATTLSDIGCAVASAILKRHDPQVRNKFLFVHSTVFTQRQILAYAKEAAPEREFKVFTIDTEAAAKQAWRQYEAGERNMDSLRGMMLRTTFGLELGMFSEVANDVLGLKMLTEDEVKELVAKYARRSVGMA